MADALRRRLRESKGPGRPPVTLGELVDLAREQGFGLLFAVLALPTLIPVLPPGTAAFVGLLFVGLGVQRALGLRHPWLPRRVRRWTLGEQAAEFLEARVLPRLERIERASQRRLTMALTEPVYRAAALSVAVLGVLMAAPLPFFNTLPALVVLVVGVGFLRRDGVFVLVGMGAAYALAAVVVGLVAAGLLAVGSGALLSVLGPLGRWLWPGWQE